MTKPETPSFRRPLGEFLVIVIGVLVALWIDAGWSWLQDRSDERTLVADLTADFTANRMELDSATTLRARSVSAGLQLLREGPEAVPADSLQAVVRAVLTLESFNPRMGALQSALGAGRIDLLRNDELRSALAAWPGLVDDASEEIEWLLPGTMRLAEAAAADLVRGTDARTILERIAGDPELSSLVAVKVVVLNEVEPDTDRVLAETNRVLSLLAGS